MTDKKILTAIKSKINELVVKNKKYKAFEDIPEKRHQLIIEGQLLGELKHFIDSMQEEPKKCMFTQDHYTEEDRKVLCEDCDEDCEYAEKVEPAEIDFEQELYKAFGQVKDFTLGMRIAKRFYDMGKNSQESVSEDFEAEWKEYFKCRGDMATVNVKDLARHFANWQKKQDQSTIEIAEDHAMLAGMDKMKEQMMKDAKSGIVEDNYIKFEDDTCIDLDPSMQLKPAFNVKEGEKVKLIVI